MQCFKTELLFKSRSIDAPSKIHYQLPGGTCKAAPQTYFEDSKKIFCLKTIEFGYQLPDHFFLKPHPFLAFLSAAFLSLAALATDSFRSSVVLFVCGCLTGASSDLIDCIEG